MSNSEQTRDDVSVTFRLQRYGALALDTIVVFEDPATKQRQQGEPYTFASTLDARCLCGSLIHPIPDAWCSQCGARVVEIRQEEGVYDASKQADAYSTTSSVWNRHCCLSR